MSMSDEEIQELIDEFEFTHPSGSDEYLLLACKVLDVLRRLHDEVKVRRLIMNPPEPTQYLVDALKEYK